MPASGFVFATKRGRAIETRDLSNPMQKMYKKLGVERATPHDLRRTHGSTVTRLKFGRDAMNRIQNHKEGGIADTYDRHDYADENREIWTAVANKILALVNGEELDKKVIVANFRR